MTYLVVLIEGLIALAMIAMTFWLRRSGRLARFLGFMLLGMSLCALTHGLSFGVLQVEGPHRRDDPRLLAGFGLVASVIPGLPLGMILGDVLTWNRRSLTTTVRSPDQSD